LLAAAGRPFRLRQAASLEDAAGGAAFVITSIRAGGMAARAADERMLLDRGLLGQETVGAAGFAKALRTIPPMIEIAQVIRSHAPAAWIINFTNPVGIITEAVRKNTQARIVGICDTPFDLYEGIAQALQTPLSQLHCDYFGLNHLGWVRAVFKGGVDCLPEILQDEGKLQAAYRHQLFEIERIQALGLLPSEYLYYYYRPDHAIANLRKYGQSRAAAIEKMNEWLWSELAHSGRPLETYERYLEQRNNSYMTVETGASGAPRGQLYAQTAGYDRIALAVMSAIHGNTGAIIPVNVDNRGAIESLEDSDVVEVPCVLGRNGALPLATGRPPSSVSSLLHMVKHYERLTVQAALTGSASQAARALAANPLIADRDLAADLLAKFRAMHGELLGYLH
jgi:6-phospho-beta-glucosidase